MCDIIEKITLKVTGVFSLVFSFLKLLQFNAKTFRKKAFCVTLIKHHQSSPDTQTDVQKYYTDLNVAAEENEETKVTFNVSIK